MRTLAAVLLILMGLVAAAIALEAYWKGRIWFRYRRGFLDLPGAESEGLWVRRSRNPVGFWAYVGAIAAAGLGCVVAAIVILSTHPHR